MRPITIRYRYSGDEALWLEAINTLISAIAGDAEIADKFSIKSA